MADLVEVKVPDIGDFSDVPIIEVLVSPGDEVAPEDPLITLESDKATMDVPAPEAGKVAELNVNVGDTVSEGSLILLPEPAGPPSSDGAGGRTRWRRRPTRRRSAAGRAVLLPRLPPRPSPPQCPMPTCGSR
jgi:pyruvate dehydrogenase E2 component (dihydrolipoamide acetyltransferase)